MKKTIKIMTLATLMGLMFSSVYADPKVNIPVKMALSGISIPAAYSVTLHMTSTTGKPVLKDLDAVQHYVSYTDATLDDVRATYTLEYITFTNDAPQHDQIDNNIKSCTLTEPKTLNELVEHDGIIYFKLSKRNLYLYDSKGKVLPTIRCLSYLNDEESSEDNQDNIENI